MRKRWFTLLIFFVLLTALTIGALVLTGAPFDWLPSPDSPVLESASADDETLPAPVETLPADQAGAVVIEPVVQPEASTVRQWLTPVQQRPLLLAVIAGAVLLGLLLVGILVVVSRLLVPPSQGISQIDTEPQFSTPEQPNQSSAPDSPPAGNGENAITVASLGASLTYAAQLIEQGQPQPAAERLRQILQDEPENPAAWYWLGAAAEAQQQWRMAQRSYLRSAELGYPHADEAVQRINENRLE